MTRPPGSDDAGGRGGAPEAREIVESILRMAEKCDGRALYFKRGVAHRDGTFLPAQQWMVDLVAAALTAVAGRGAAVREALLDVAQRVAGEQCARAKLGFSAERQVGCDCMACAARRALDLATLEAQGDD